MTTFWQIEDKSPWECSKEVIKVKFGTVGSGTVGSGTVSSTIDSSSSTADVVSSDALMFCETSEEQWKKGITVHHAAILAVSLIDKYVGLAICPSGHGSNLFICLSVFDSMFPYLFSPSICLSFHLSHSSICYFIHPSVISFIHLFVSVDPFIHFHLYFLKVTRDKFTQCCKEKPLHHSVQYTHSVIKYLIRKHTLLHEQ